LICTYQQQVEVGTGEAEKEGARGYLLELLKDARQAVEKAVLDQIERLLGLVQLEHDLHPLLVDALE
jgi:hypothetical protein